MKRSRLIWAVVVLLYTVTWIGGFVSHRHAVEVDAQERYDDARQRELEEAAWYAKRGGEKPNRITRDGGPVVNVNWCFPVLPGVLIAESEYIVGPLYGKGGVSVVVYYGVGSLQIGPIAGWSS